MRLRALATVASFVAAMAAQSCLAGCYCGGYPYYCFGSGVWTDTPGTTVVTTTYGASATDAKDIGSCPYAGATPPTKVCLANGGSTKVKTIELSGEIGADGWGITGTVGEEQTVELTCGGPATINGWCQCCSTRARIKYKNTFKCGTCACSNIYGFSCSNSYCGTRIDYDGVACDEPGCTVPSNCNPDCPPPEG